MAGIFWLAAYPKSGMTWLRAFLANYYRNDETALSINDLSSYALDDSPSCSVGDGLKTMPVTDSPATFVRTHNLFWNVGDWPGVMQKDTAGAIYIVRHPFDIAVSWSYHYLADLDRAVDTLCCSGLALPRANGRLPPYLGTWSEHVRSWTTAPGLARHVMRYEDMQTQPRVTFAALMSFLRLSPDSERLKRAIRFSCFRELAAQERDTGFVEARPDGSTRFFREGALGAGVTVLTDRQKSRICDALGETMSCYGYGKEGAASEWVNAG